MSITHARRTARRGAAVLLAAGVAVLAAALPASAHVTVNPKTAEQGGFGKFSFRVPTERPVATTKVEIVFPAEHPLPFVSVRPLPGWQVKVEKAKLAKPIDAHGTPISEAVSKITWSGGAIAAGQFQEFDVSMGPLPKDTDSLTFKALQTYANGEVVRWIQTAQEGQPEPEDPAPVLSLTPAAEGDHHGGSDKPAAETAAKADTAVTVAQTGKSGDTTARILGGLGLAVGLAGIAATFLTRRRTTS